MLLKPPYLKRIVFSSGFYAFPVGPLFAIYTFGPTILSAFGVGSGGHSNLGSVAIDMVFLAGCIPALKLIETWGRRPLIIWCFAIMSIPLFILGFAPSAPVGVVVACFLVYALFSGGPSILEWAYPSELFPTNVRASGRRHHHRREPHRRGARHLRPPVRPLGLGHRPDHAGRRRRHLRGLPPVPLPRRGDPRHDPLPGGRRGGARRRRRGARPRLAPSGALRGGLGPG